MRKKYIKYNSTLLLCDERFKVYEKIFEKLGIKKNERKHYVVGILILFT